VRDALYGQPPAHLPDTPETRSDMASFKAGARSLDQGVGAVLDALDALVSHVDLYPTLCELAGAPLPDGLAGRSLLPLARGETPEIRDELFAELTYHAAYDPQRAIRTKRHNYIRHFGDRLEPVLPNVDDSPSKDLLVAAGWGQRKRPREELYDLVMDPGEMRNLAGDPTEESTRAELEARPRRWMAETADPLLDGPVPIPPGAVVNRPDGLSPNEPYAGAPD
jgi:N-sulfoglucosamine sulfohydrolase